MWTLPGITAHGLVGSRGADVHLTPHTPQKTMPRRSPFGLSVWSACPALDRAVLVHCASLWPKVCSSSLSTAPRWPKGSSSMLVPYVTFLGADCLTGTQAALECWKSARCGKLSQRLDDLQLAERFVDPMSADHEVLNIENESGLGHRSALVVQDHTSGWLQCRSRNVWEIIGTLRRSLSRREDRK